MSRATYNYDATLCGNLLIDKIKTREAGEYTCGKRKRQFQCFITRSRHGKCYSFSTWCSLSCPCVLRLPALSRPSPGPGPVSPCSSLCVLSPPPHPPLYFQLMGPGIPWSVKWLGCGLDNGSSILYGFQTDLKFILSAQPSEWVQAVPREIIRSEREADHSPPSSAQV